MNHPVLSITRQCELLGLARSSLYYEPASESPLNLALMGRIDRQYTATPFYGSPRMTVLLQGLGYAVGHKRVERLMRLMGLAAVQPRRSLSQPHPRHPKYPYLLRNLAIERPGQVWSSDITYIGLRGGFLYLVAVLDWFSRYVLSWELSNSLDADFCVTALRRALELGQPEIVNTDQGSQFTGDAWTGLLDQREIAISMDGRGRCFDNIFTERLWRTVKYEEVYLSEYADGEQAWRALERYFIFYNQQRPHQALGWRTPAQVHYEQEETRAAA
jgi:putative transposase